MKQLVQAFTQAMPAHLRREVYTAIATTPTILAGQWIDDKPNDFDGGGQGCVMIVAGFAAINEPIRRSNIPKKHGGKKWMCDDYEAAVAKMLGVSEEIVSSCWQEWDNMDDDGRAKFRAFIGQELAALPQEEEIPQSVLIPVHVPVGILAGCGN